MKTEISTLMRTDLLSEVLTEHKQKLGALNPDLKFVVTEIHGDEKLTEALGYIETKGNIDV